MKSNEVYCIAAGVKARKEDFGLLVVSKTTPALALNQDMKAVWELIDGKRTCKQIADTIATQYPESDVTPKIAEIFDILCKTGLVQLVEEV